MVQLVVLIVFSVVLVTGSLSAALAGRLPTAHQLAEEDRKRFAQYTRELRR